MTSTELPLVKSQGRFIADLSPNRLADEALPFGVRHALAPAATAINGIAAHALEFDGVAPRGRPMQPVSEQQMFDKFADCLDAGRSPIAAEILFGRLSARQSISAHDLTAVA